MASQMPDARVLKTTVEFTAARARRRGRACSRASGKAIEFAGFRRAYVEGSDDPESELEAQETILPAFKVGDLVVAAGRRRGRRRPGDGVAGRPRAEEARDAAAGAVHRGVAHQEAGGGGDRPAVHLRADDRDHPAARLRVPPGQGARAELHGVRGDAAAARRTSPTSSTSGSPPRWRRTSTRSRTASVPGSISSASSSAATGGSTGLEAMARDEEQHIDYPVIEIGVDPESGRADPRAHRAVRAVRAGGRGRRRQHGVAARGPAAGRPHRREGDGAACGPRPRARATSASIRRPGSTCTCATGRFGPLRAAGRDAREAGEGREGREAEAGVAARAASARRRSTSTRRCSCSACRARSARTRTTARTSSPSAGRFGPYVKHGDEFRSLEAATTSTRSRWSGRSSCWRRRSRSRRRQSAARTVLRELGARAGHRRGGEAARRPLRAVRHRRQDERVAAEGRRPGGLGLREAVELLKRARRPGRRRSRRGARRPAAAAGASRPPRCRSA